MKINKQKAKCLLASILTVAMLSPYTIVEAKSYKSSSKPYSSSTKSYKSSKSSTKSGKYSTSKKSSTNSSKTTTNKNNTSYNKTTTTNKTINSNTYANNNTSNSSTNNKTTTENTTKLDLTKTTNKKSSLKVDSGDFTSKPTTTNNSNKSSSSKTSYTVKPKEKKSNYNYNSTYYTKFNSKRYYSSDLNFFKYYMIANLLTNNNRDKISERDIVYALEENGYTDSEIDSIMVDLENEQTNYDKTINKEKASKKEINNEVNPITEAVSFVLGLGTIGITGFGLFKLVKIIRKRR